jgi:phage terminase small subunit
MEDRKERFAQEYIKDLKATQAAIRAGYSPRSAHSQASRLLKNRKVSERIAELKAKVEQRIVISAAKVLEELGRIALCDIGQAFNEDGTLKPVHEIPEDCRRALAAMEVEEATPGIEVGGKEGLKMSLRYVKKVKFWNKHEALVTLAKHFRLLNEKSEEKDNGQINEFIAFMKSRK